VIRLHAYQETAIDWLLAHDRGALLLEMGLGKTAIALTALVRDPERLPALVIAPKQVAENVWRQEAARFAPSLRVSVAVGTPRVRAEALEDLQADVCVVTRDNLAEVPARWGTVILDELSSFKNRASKRFKHARRLTKDARTVWGLTGTPAPNGLLDLWAQMWLIDHGEALGSTLTAYRSRYFSPGHILPTGVVTEWLLRPGADARIHQLLETSAISMRNDGRLDLPETVENVVRITLPPEARAAYKRLRSDMVLDLDLVTGAQFTAGNAATLGSRLTQLTAGALYHDLSDAATYHRIHHAKRDALLDIVEQASSPVLVFYRYRFELEDMLAHVPGAVALSKGDSETVSRWNAGDIPVLLAHPASAGMGLNLQAGGHTMVWTSLPWSLEEWQQACARLVRQGQKHSVVIHIIQAEGTLDRRQRDVLAGKATVQDALMSHLESSE